MGPVQGTATGPVSRTRCKAGSCQGESSSSSCCSISHSSSIVSSQCKTASSPGHGFSKELQRFWQQLPLSQRCSIMRVGRKELFQRIRESYCSRCFRAFQLRYDELRSAHLDCPMCREAYAGLVVTPDGAITLDQSLLAGEPWGTFTAAAAQRTRRDEAFAGDKDVCGSSWQKKAGVHQCGLHTYAVPPAAFMEFWASLPPDAAGELLVLPEEDFVAELDAHLKYQLKICKDCHFNVVRAFKDLKAGREVPNAACSSRSSSAGQPSAAPAAAPGACAVQADVVSAVPSAGSGQPCVVHQCNPLSSRAAAALLDSKSRTQRPPSQQQPQQEGLAQPHGAALPGHETASTADDAGATAVSTSSSSSSGGQMGLELSPGTWMTVSGGMVTIAQPATSMRSFFDAAEDVQVNKVASSPAGAAQLVAGVRHAETPELAVGVLREAGLLIFRSGVEGAYREQLAAHNALLLFVVLVLDMMGARLRCAAEDVRARAAAEELVKVWDATPATSSTKKGAGAAANTSKKVKAPKSKAGKAKAKGAAAAAMEAAPGPKQQQQQQPDQGMSAAGCCEEQAAAEEGGPGSSGSAPTTPAAACSRSSTGGRAGAPALELLLDMDKLQLLALQEGCVLAEEEEPMEEATAGQAGLQGHQQGPPPSAHVQQQQQQQPRAGPGLHAPPPPPPPPPRPQQHHQHSGICAAEGPAGATGRAFSCDLASRDRVSTTAGLLPPVVSPAAGGRAGSPGLMCPTSPAAACPGGNMGGVYRTLSSCSSNSTLDAAQGAGALLLDDPTAWPSLGAASCGSGRAPHQRAKQAAGGGAGGGSSGAAPGGALTAHAAQQQQQGLPQVAGTRQGAGGLSRTSSLSSSMTAGSDGHWVLLGGGYEEVAEGRASSCSSSHGTAGSGGHGEGLTGWEMLGVPGSTASLAAPSHHGLHPGATAQGQAGAGRSMQGAASIQHPCSSLWAPSPAAPTAAHGALAAAASQPAAALAAGGRQGTDAAAAAGAGGFSLFTFFPTSVRAGNTGQLRAAVPDPGWQPDDSWVAVGRPHAGRLAPGGAGVVAAASAKMPAKPVQDSSKTRAGGEGLSSTYSLF